MYHFKVDVIAGDANAAAYKYYKKQEHQYLHDSSVAVMLREMQREVNTGHPFERRLHIDYSTNNHPTQLHAPQIPWWQLKIMTFASRERVLGLQDSDLWLRPADLSWHLPILMARTFEKWKAKEDKAEEFKKQKMQKNDDGQSYANWQTSFSWQ